MFKNDYLNKRIIEINTLIELKEKAKAEGKKLEDYSIVINLTDECLNCIYCRYNEGQCIGKKESDTVPCILFKQN
jgi:hypothetical protein